MTLALLIQKGGLRRLAAVTRLPPRLPGGSVAKVAGVAVAISPVRDAENICEWQRERAAIMAFDGGLPDEEADAKAWARTLLHFQLPDDYRLH